MPVLVFDWRILKLCLGEIFRFRILGKKNEDAGPLGSVNAELLTLFGDKLILQGKSLPCHLIVCQ